MFTKQTPDVARQLAEARRLLAAAQLPDDLTLTFIDRITALERGLEIALRMIEQQAKS